MQQITPMTSTMPERHIDSVLQASLARQSPVLRSVGYVAQGLGPDHLSHHPSCNRNRDHFARLTQAHHDQRGGKDNIYKMSRIYQCQEIPFQGHEGREAKCVRRQQGPAARLDQTCDLSLRSRFHTVSVLFSAHTAVPLCHHSFAG